MVVFVLVVVLMMVELVLFGFRCLVVLVVVRLEVLLF